MSQTQVIYTELLSPSGVCTESKYNVSLSPRRSTKSRPSDLHIAGRRPLSAGKKPLFYSPGWLPGTPFNIPTPRLALTTQYDFSDLTEVFSTSDPPPSIISMKDDLVSRRGCGSCRMYVWLRGVLALAVLIVAILGVALVLKHATGVGNAAEETTKLKSPSVPSSRAATGLSGTSNEATRSQTGTRRRPVTVRGEHLQVTGSPTVSNYRYTTPGPVRIYSVNEDYETLVETVDF